VRRRIGLIVFVGAVLGHASVAAAIPAVGVVSIKKVLNSDWVTEYTGYIGGEHLLVTYSPTRPFAGDVTFRELGGGTILTSEDACSGSGTSVIVCAVVASEGPPLRVNSGPGDDSIDLRSWPARAPYLTSAGADGGDGNDTILGGPGVDQLAGSAGADVVRGGDGADHIDGGRGGDLLFGEGGDDTLLHGDGTFVLFQALDRLDCGPGTDIGNWAPPDLAVGCETRR
jgi:hypothetical protein